MSNPKNSISQLFDLSGKVAIVTGGGMGIGRGVSLRLAEAGASVLIADINLEAANKTINLIKENNGKAAAVQADTTKVADARMVADKAVEDFGGLDILINNAGIYPLSSIVETTENLWDKVLDTNLKGYFFFLQAAAEKMIQAGKGGRIVNIASIEAFHPTGSLVHYDSSKGGVVMMTKATAAELAKYGINVTAIAPGSVVTPGTTAASDPLLDPKVIEEVFKGFIARIPLGRMGVPDDIAKVALFLVSGAADYITGQTIIVDGGYLLA